MFSMLFSVVLQGAIQLSFAQQFTQNEKYQESEVWLDKNVLKYNRNEYYYYKTVNAFQTNRRAEAIKNLKSLSDSWDELKLTERQFHVVFLMKNEMMNWKEGDLLDISADMKNIEARMRNGKGGPETQKEQKKVIEKLEKHIKQLEDDAAAAAASAAAAAEKNKDAQAKNAQDKQIAKPQDDSVLGKQSGDGKIDEKNLKTIAESWGRLPEKERGRVLMELSHDLPPRYRDVLENYSKVLAREPKK